MRRRNARIKGLLAGLLVLAALFLFIKWLFFSPGRAAEKVVEEFYHDEQVGDFSGAWALFHSTMKKRLPKKMYIKDRPHVFISDFGVKTFTYTIGKPEKLNNWKMSGQGPTLRKVYKLPVTETFKGKYGNFDLKQEVFAVQEKGEWRIVWDYNQ